MNGIDISSWQSGIDLSAVPCDFVIIKATQGTTYVNPDCDRAYNQAKKLGKKLGLYHFANNGNSAKSEADFFLKKVGNRVGECILVLDYEADALKQGVSWAKTWLDHVYSKTGVRPLIYMSKAVTRQSNWAQVAKDYGLWGAQYANFNKTGYQSNPWSDSNPWGAWGTPAIFQYSSTGRLSGYAGNLDLNIFYGNSSQWDKFAGAKTTSGGANLEVDGYWGTNTTKALQTYLKTPVDGIVSGQYSAYTRNNPGLTSGWEWVSNPTGSTMIMCLQKLLCVVVDGIAGPKTFSALQKRMGTEVDGEIWEKSPCVKELQRRLNSGKL